jgi:DNA-binding HxlR family transcriptional regulator
VGTRTYGQYCGLAKALDLVGERWTLLIVRELLMGPKRYTDLREALAGIASNLLAERLARLEALGLVVRERLSPPAPATVYQLTERGRALDPAIVELGRWGGLALGEPESDEEFRASWFALGMRATFRPRAAAGVDTSYEFHIGAEVFGFDVAAGRAQAFQGPAAAPALVVEADAPTFLALIGGRLAPAQALEDRILTIEGPPHELDRVLRMFGFPADEASGRT